MNPMTHVEPDSVSSVQPFGISPAPRTGVVKFLGFITAFVGVCGVIGLPFGLLTMNSGAWLGAGDTHRRAAAMTACLIFELLVALLACAAGIAAGAGKVWSRFGMRMYATIALALAVIGIYPVIVYIVQGKADLGFQHALEVLVIIKQWIIELPLAIAILYTFSRKTIKDAYASPVINSPDRSQR